MARITPGRPARSLAASLLVFGGLSFAAPSERANGRLPNLEWDPVETVARLSGVDTSGPFMVPFDLCVTSTGGRIVVAGELEKSGPAKQSSLWLWQDHGGEWTRESVSGAVTGRIVDVRVACSTEPLHIDVAWIVADGE